MAKLLPPIVEGTIPAFYSEENGMVNITIPFSMNRAVNKNAVDGIAVKIKTLQSSSAILDEKEYTNLSMGNNSFVSFRINRNYFTLKQFYKFQIAYIDRSNTIGYYSSVAIGKYTDKPEIYIDGLSPSVINYHSHSYSGIYKNNDYTENVYNYRFDLTDSNNTIVFTTGDLVHNSLNDDNLGETMDLCTIAQDLDEGTYYLQYSVTTNNNLSLQTQKYMLKKSFNIQMDVEQPILTAIPDNDNGIITVIFNSKKPTPQSIDGNFIIYRSDEDENFLNWKECYYFSLNNNYIDFSWNDYTVEHKKQYKYAIAQFNKNGLYSEKIESNIKTINNVTQSEPVYIDFEDIFLYDGLKQLRIKYNPKVASFKNNTPESKIETIGKQHPFILRNGSVSYKEFPVSGLITYFMNTNINNDLYRKDTFGPHWEEIKKIPGVNEIKKVYIKQNDKYILFTHTLFELLLKGELKCTSYFIYQTERINNIEISTISTDLTSDNIYKERQFKLEVLDWLTNGKPKLFRSPTEGNYLVRLLNVSLTPNDQLGRMLHTFNCTAYEIAEPTYENMNMLNILGFNAIQDQVVTQWKTIDLSTQNVGSNLLGHVATTIRFYDMQPGQIIRLTFTDGNVQDIIIGMTGMYRLENTKYSIISAILLNNIQNTGYLTYSFDEKVMNDFKKFNEIEMFNIPDEQFIGKHNIIKELLEISNIRNSKVDLMSIPRIKFYRRPTLVLKKKNEQYYKHNGIIETIMTNNDYNEYTLYIICDENTKLCDFMEYHNGLVSILSDSKEELQEVNQHLFEINIGDSIISVEDSQDFVYHPQDLSLFTCASNDLQLRTNPGVITEMSYIFKSQTYILESNEQYLIKNKKDIYLDDLIQLDNIYNKLPAMVYINDNTDEQNRIESWSRIGDNTWDEYIRRQRIKINQHYEEYILILEDELYKAQILEGTLGE